MSGEPQTVDLAPNFREWARNALLECGYTVSDREATILGERLRLAVEIERAEAASRHPTWPDGEAAIEVLREVLDRWCGGITKADATAFLADLARQS